MCIASSRLKSNECGHTKPQVKNVAREKRARAARVAKQLSVVDKGDYTVVVGVLQTLKAAARFDQNHNNEWKRRSA